MVYYVNELAVDNFVVDHFESNEELYFLALFSGSEVVESRDGRIFYETTVKKACDRLDVLGFTLGHARNVLTLDKNTFYQSLDFFKKYHLQFDLEKQDLSYDLNSIEAAYRVIFQKYLRCGGENTELGYDTSMSVLGNYLAIFNRFRDENYKLPYLRFMLSLFDDDKILSQNVDNLIQNLFHGDKDFFKSIDYKNYHRWKTYQDHALYDKTIILTEGKTDLEFLSRSLKILYPHLIDYYHFMDFGIVNSKGGACALIDQLKGFIGSGINNRVIGILDNDTAAFVARKSIEKLVLPENITLIHYPYLTLAEEYPTLGPTGNQLVNINGLACSIELYLGLDILLDENNKPIPIQWKGYDQSIKKYQGEILDKGKIQQKFYQKLKACDENPSLVDNYDWNGIKLILQAIFDCFKDSLPNLPPTIL